MKIVIGVDGREHQRDAIALGGLLAEAAGGEILVAHVYALDWVMPSIGPLYGEAIRKEAVTVVEQAGEALGRAYEVRVVGDGSAVRGLHQRVEAERADLLVLASS